MLKEASTQVDSMKVTSVNLKGQFRYITWCDKPSVMIFGNSTEETT